MHSIMMCFNNDVFQNTVPDFDPKYLLQNSRSGASEIDRETSKMVAEFARINRFIRWLGLFHT